jgi:hypothetical protein
MIVKIENWTIAKTVKLQDKIDPKPQYQRGNVWTPKDNALLIDSILKGYDIPKIYLRKSHNDSIYSYEIADGQQRLYAISKFHSGDVLIKEIELEGKIYKNLDYNQLASNAELTEVKNRFDRFSLTISILEDADEKEVRTLFARLQMGKTLNEPEKRNAIGSAIGYAIDLEVSTCEFFKNSKITISRFNRQDYLAHAITLIHFRNERDLKADAIKSMYDELYIKYPMKYMKATHKVLGWINEVNSHCNGRVKNKWAFIDFFWLFYRKFEQIESIDAEKIAEKFDQFESKRLQYSKQPEVLIDPENTEIYERGMYDYIFAFNLSGSAVDNINTRARVFDKTFVNFIKLRK